MAEFIISNCVVCGKSIDNGVRVTQANRQAKGKGGGAYVCAACTEAKAKRNARNKVERGASNEAELEYRITVPCEYTLTAKAEFCKNDWLACDGALKSPKYQNLKWQRKLETLDKLLASGDIILANGKVSVSVLRGSRVLECERVAYTGKTDFLDFVRDLVAKHKAEIYFAKYGKTFGYDNK